MDSIIDGIVEAVERDDEYYEDGDLCRIGKVVAWMPIEPPKEDA